MIKNDAQLAVATRKHAEMLEQARQGDDLGEAVYSQLASELEEQIKEYRAIHDHYCKVFRVSRLDEIGEVLIKCRLARGWTQRELAETVGVKEQQIQRYEAGEYEGAALWRVAELLDALGYSFEGRVFSPEEEPGGIGLSYHGLWNAVSDQPEPSSTLIGATSKCD